MTIETDFNRFREKFRDLDFSKDSGNFDIDYAACLPIAQAMSANSSLQGPLFEASHRPYIGSIVRLLKGSLRYLSRPWINIVLNHQKRMNSLTTSLAFEVAALQLKVRQLEEVQRKNRNSTFSLSGEPK
ncbi:MAG: hypothetical protein OXT67_12560 [Zetaproteobacteria bacterium]|nr:hypothetical protein [Zetaproteobacteria bacterium]